jgi:hypothetical protein
MGQQAPIPRWRSKAARPPLGPPSSVRLPKTTRLGRAPATARSAPASPELAGNKFSLPPSGHDVLGRPGARGALPGCPCCPHLRRRPLLSPPPREQRTEGSGWGGGGIPGLGNRYASARRTAAGVFPPRAPRPIPLATARSLRGTSRGARPPSRLPTSRRPGPAAA